MQVKKVINNNLVYSCDEQGKDCIVMGRGLGYQQHPGDEIDAQKIEKVYKISDPIRSDHFTQLVKDIPLSHLQVANMAIDYAFSILDKKLSDNIYISLIDHIDFALERIEKGIPLKNKLLYEIKRFYPTEFLIGTEALNIVERQLGIKFPEDEAGYIAIHLVEAEVDTDNVNYVQQSVEMIQAILNIIKYHYSLELSPDSLAYERLLVHLRYFADRVINQQRLSSSDEKFIAKMIINFADEYECTKKIRTYIQKTFDYEVSDEEMIYLAVHIHRVLSDRKARVNKEESND